VAMFALLQATRDRLRQRLGLDKSTCRVMHSARPAITCGDTFFSVFGLSWSPGDPDLNRGLDEYYGVGVCLTCRTAYIPSDDQAEEAYIKLGSSMEEMIRRAVIEIHQNISLMQAANSLLGSSLNKIIEPLRWQGGDAQPVEVGAQWFGAAYRPDTDQGEDFAGLTLTANFGQARRVQTFANMR
jgi:hypothetical protein